MATLLGSMVVFVPRFYKPEVLGISLALAAGVMIYVSFVEIFFKGKPKTVARASHQALSPRPQALSSLKHTLTKSKGSTTALSPTRSMKRRQTRIMPPLPRSSRE